jgi:hypothetical protein
VKIEMKAVLKTCPLCHREFDSRDTGDDSPAGGIGSLFLEAAGGLDPEELCPDCREEIGVFNLLGFDV